RAAGAADRAAGGGCDGRRPQQSAADPTEPIALRSAVKILCTQSDGRWLAHAVREDTGHPFGIECAGATEHETIERLTRWLGWQKEHTAALEALQQAQRGYHRTIAGSAFANPTEGPT